MKRQTVSAADFFLERLERLCRLRREYREDLNPLGIRLLDRVINATACDAFDQGARDLDGYLARHLPADIIATIGALSCSPAAGETLYFDES